MRGFKGRERRKEGSTNQRTLDTTAKGNWFLNDVWWHLSDTHFMLFHIIIIWGWIKRKKYPKENNSYGPSENGHRRARRGEMHSLFARRWRKFGTKEASTQAPSRASEKLRPSVRDKQQVPPGIPGYSWVLPRKIPPNSADPYLFSLSANGKSTEPSLSPRDQHITG